MSNEVSTPHFSADYRVHTLLLRFVLATFIVESVVVIGSQKMGTGTGIGERERSDEDDCELDAVGVVVVKVAAAANVAPFAGELQSYVFKWPSSALFPLLR